MYIRKPSVFVPIKKDGHTPEMARGSVNKRILIFHTLMGFIPIQIMGSLFMLLLCIVVICFNSCSLCGGVPDLQAGQTLISPERLQQALGQEHIIVAQDQALSDQV